MMPVALTPSPRAGNFRLFVVPIILWTYIASVILARHSWGIAYDKLITAFDLTPNQAWILPVLVNLLVAVLGIPRTVAFILSVRKAEIMTESYRLAGILCISALGLCLMASISGAMQNRERLVTGARELGDGEQKDIFNAGNVSNDIYSNDVIGVTIQLPKDWRLMSLNGIRRAKYSGAYAATGGNAEKAEASAADRNGSYTLFAVRRNPDDSVGYNPSLVLGAYEKKKLETTGLMDLGAFANDYTSSIREPYHLVLGPLVAKIGNKTGYHIQIEGRFPGKTIQQHLYFTQTDTLYIVLTASVMDETDLTAMRTAIQTLQLLK